jgi:cyclopropane-fatty-acyl-phospholipid synthase
MTHFEEQARPRESRPPAPRPPEPASRAGSPARGSVEAAQGWLVEQMMAALSARIGGGVAFTLEVMDRPALRFGDGAPRFTLGLRTPRAVRAAIVLDESALGEAYLDGDLDIEGDFVAALRLRAGLGDSRHLSRLWATYAKPILVGQERQDEDSIREHYDEDPEFYLSFLDPRWRCYSHGYFSSDDEPLEAAIERKLDAALAAVSAKPGDRVLDIGAGWGAFTQFAGARGVRVTSLTISAPSETYVNALIERRRLPCEVVRRHFLEYRAERPFDAIVNLGVSEHLPDYEATAAQYLRLVKPGGRIFLDACSSLEKHSMSSFTKKHVWPGNSTPLVLDEHLGVMQRAGLELKQVTDDRWSYHLTTRRWAENLEAARAEVVARFGERQYRRFRLYLWGCAHGFATRNLGAFRVLLERPADGYARERFSRAWARMPLAALLRRGSSVAK